MDKILASLARRGESQSQIAIILDNSCGLYNSKANVTSRITWSQRVHSTPTGIDEDMSTPRSKKKGSKGDGDKAVATNGQTSPVPANTLVICRNKYIHRHPSLPYLLPSLLPPSPRFLRIYSRYRRRSAIG